MVKRIGTALSVLTVFLSLFMTPLFGNKPVVIVSGSMEPTIQTGALTLVHFTVFEGCEVGDIITYYHPGFNELVTHRIVEKGPDYYWTKGDANTERDSVAVVKDNFYGKVMLTANWTAPILKPWLVDRQVDKAALMSIIIVVGAICSVVCVVISLVSTYLYSLQFVFRNKGYAPEQLKELYNIHKRIQDRCVAHRELPTWKRVKLNLAFRVWKRTLEDLDDEIKKL